PRACRRRSVEALTTGALMSRPLEAPRATIAKVGRNRAGAGKTTGTAHILPARRITVTPVARRLSDVAVLIDDDDVPSVPVEGAEVERGRDVNADAPVEAAGSMHDVDPVPAERRPVH